MARLKQPGQLDPKLIGRALQDGLGSWRLAYCVEKRQPVLTYNENRRGSDRACMEQNRDVITQLLNINRTGVFWKTSSKAGWAELDAATGVNSGMAESYTDDQVWVLQKLLIDLGRIRRRRKVTGTFGRG
eukprot:6345086-Alexandrium_andersonii.AAC.1